MAKIVEKAPYPPGCCAITGDIDGPWIDTEVWFAQIIRERQDDPHVYLHVPLVEQYARELLGMVTEADFRQALARGDLLSERLDEMKAEIEELRATLAAMERLESMVKA